MATLSPNGMLSEYFNECVGVFIATFSIIILEKLVQGSSARASTLLQECVHTHVTITITSDKHLKQ